MVVYVNGTFSYCPKYFTRMFTKRGFINEYYIPLVLCLPSDKSTLRSYANFLKSVCEYGFRNIVRMFPPSAVVIDSERAIHFAWKNCLASDKENTRTTFSSNILTQSWNKNIFRRNCSSIDHKDKNSDIRSAIYRCSILCLPVPGLHLNNSGLVNIFSTWAVLNCIVSFCQRYLRFV